MLNLDLLGAIAFDKGCYTGQEVIARAHYRGRVKRRLQRWHATAGARLAPGRQRAYRRWTRTYGCARSARPDGGWDLLAVGTFAGAGAGIDRTHAARCAAVDGPLPLPYSLPE